MRRALERRPYQEPFGDTHLDVSGVETGTQGVETGLGEFGRRDCRRGGRIDFLGLTTNGILTVNYKDHGGEVVFTGHGDDEYMAEVDINLNSG